MGRAKYNKRNHIEESNKLFENRNKRSLLSEQYGSAGQYFGVATGADQCMRLTAIKCEEANDPNPTTWTYPCVLIDGQLPDQSSVNTTIQNSFGAPNTTRFIVQTVVPMQMSYLSLGPTAWISDTTSTQCLGPGTQTGTTNPLPMTCYGCENGQIITDSGFSNSNINGVCGTINGVTMYDSQTHPDIVGCGGSNNPVLTGTTGGPTPTGSTTTCDFSFSGSCAQTHLQTGAQNSWTQWLSLREQGFNQAGCQHLQSAVNWLTNQLNGGVVGPNQPNAGAPLTPIAIARKTEKRNWVQCMAAECNCPPLNVPPLTTTGATGDWWCDPTGQYVNPNGGNCVQSPNQPQSYFTGPYVSEADCNSNCTGGNNNPIDPDPCEKFAGLDPATQKMTCEAFFALSDPNDDPNLASWTNYGRCCPDPTTGDDSIEDPVREKPKTRCRETGKPEVGCYACKADPSKPYPEGEFSQEYKCLEITQQRLPLVIQYGLRPYDTMEECMEFSYCGKGRPKDADKPQTGGPTPPPKGDKPKDKPKDKSKLNEEINRMKKLWDHK